MNWPAWWRETIDNLDLEALGAIGTILLLAVLAFVSVIFLSAPMWLR